MRNKKYTIEPPNSHTPNCQTRPKSRTPFSQTYPNSHTCPNSHTYLNSHTLFGFTKMWLFCYANDIRRITSLIFELFFEFCQKVQSNFVLRNIRIFFSMIFNPDFLVDGEPYSLFLYWHQFFCLRKFRKLRKQFFFYQKIIFRIINKNRFLIQVATFLVSRNCDYLEAL